MEGRLVEFPRGTCGPSPGLQSAPLGPFVGPVTRPIGALSTFRYIGTLLWFLERRATVSSASSPWP